MGRPRLYHTEEEKKAANRLKSKKHYDSNRDVLLRRRRQVARERREPKGPSPTAVCHPKPRVLPARTSSEERLKHKLELIQERVQKASRRFEEATSEKTAAGFLTLICIGISSHYEAGQVIRAKDFIMEKEVALRRIQRSLENYRDMAQTIAESGEEWKDIEVVAARVRKVIHGLDDLLCAAMVDPADLVDRFRAGQLEFQINP